MKLVLILALGVCLVKSQVSTTSSPQHWMDPTVNGRWTNPGARISLSNKTMDMVNEFAAEAIAWTYMNMTIPDFHVSIGNGLLTIKSPHITEFKFDRVHADYSSPARIDSYLGDGKLMANGEWTYRQVYNRHMEPLNGTYRVGVTHAQLNTTTQLSRNSDSKPWAQLIDCDAWLGQYKVDIDGAPSVTVVLNANDPISNKIRGLFEESVCVAVRKFVKRVINTQLATFPNSILIRTKQQNKIEIDYDLLNNEPKYVDGFLQTGLEGKTTWRGSNYAPFSPNDLRFTGTDRMMAFELSDFTFNTMLHQAHSQGFRFSAAQMLSHSSSIHDQLQLNCTQPIQPSNIHTRNSNSKPNQPYKPKPKPTPKASRILESESIGELKCLGAVFENATTSIGQFVGNVSGDLVFKSNQKAPSIFIHSKDHVYFDASNAVLEVYGPIKDNNDQRQLLAKADVQILQGHFIPTFVNGNFTGSIKITKFELKQGSIGWSAQTRALDDDWMAKLEQFSKPIITDMFNVFFNKYAQFPIPLLKGFECDQPNFIVSTRSLQVDCDLKFAAGTDKFWGSIIAATIGAIGAAIGG